MMDNLVETSGVDLAASIKKGSRREDDVYTFFKERIKKIDPYLNSFIEVYDNPPVTDLEESDSGSSLKGVAIAIKDNICIKEKKITCASKILSTHTAVYDATVIKRLKSAGLKIIGTTNMDEFAFGSSTENSCYGVTKNPWDQTRVPGGSSGGSAAAVAARLVPFALGSDTGGSVRQPASFCGVVGFKPTYGRISRYGLVAFGSSLDQIGPITTNFIDCAHLLNIICGVDSKDSTSASLKVPDFTDALVDSAKNVKIGIPKEYFGQGMDKEVREFIQEAINFYRKKKADIYEINLPHTEYAVATYYLVASSEAGSNLQRFDGVKYGFRADSRGGTTENRLIDMYKQTRGQGLGDEAKRRVLLGTYSLSSGYYDAYYLRALKVRRLIKQELDSAFEEVDAILTATSPTPAFEIGEKVTEPLSMYLSDIYTISANLAGLPAVSFSCGFTKHNLPVGVQLIGRPFDESTLIRLGFTYQSSTDYHKRIPPVM